MTSKRPPGSDDDAEKDLTAPCDVASTGAECNNPATQRAIPATANTANAFLTNAFLPFALSLAAIDSAVEVGHDDRYRMFLADDPIEVVYGRRYGFVPVDYAVVVLVILANQAIQPHVHHRDRHSDGVPGPLAVRYAHDQGVSSSSRPRSPGES